MLSLGIISLLTAIINYTNFSIANAPDRIKSINTRKVLGSSNFVLRMSLISEAVILCLLSYIITILLLYYINTTFLKEFLTASVAIEKNIKIYIIGIIIPIVAGLIAGVYPAYYITSFPAALALKGTFSLSPTGVKFRNVLIGFQYIITFIIIIAASFIYSQNYYMQHTDLGFNKDQIIVTNFEWGDNSARDFLSNELKRNPHIENVGFANGVISSNTSIMSWGRSYNGNRVDFTAFPVDENMFDILELTLIDGRKFSELDKLSPNGALLMNETAIKQYDIKINDQIADIPILGTFKDFHFKPMNTAIEPMALFLKPQNNWGNFLTAYIKVKAKSNMFETMDFVKKTIKKNYPEYTESPMFYDTILQNTYQNEKYVSALVSLFGFASILISIVGVFGLVLLECHSKEKKIGVRRVYGASVNQIILSFNKIYIKILVLCFVISVPFGVAITKKWMENFAYRISISWWMFLLVFIAVLLITVATVSVQVFKSANNNPVDNLKSE
ncbi:MAG: hypothetical protein Q4F97_00595 [Bacteroidales bacterium]|nr:hypothetical protein [Bacteroidales bacterium]